MSQKQNDSNWVSRALASGRGAIFEFPADPESLNEDDGFQSDAEYLLAIGRILQARLRRGRDIEGIASMLNHTVHQCNVALEFSLSSSGLILEALVEDWTYEQVESAIM